MASSGANVSSRGQSVSPDGRIVEKYYDFLYDFSVLGGSNSGSPLTLTDLNGDALQIDSGDLVCRSVIYVKTAVVGSTSTVSVDLGSDAAGILAATAEATLAANAVIVSPTLNTAVFATGGKYLSAATSVKATTASGDLTAGKFVVRVYTIPAQL